MWIKDSLGSHNNNAFDKMVLYVSILQAWLMTLVWHFCLSMKIWWKFSSGATVRIHMLYNK